MIKTESLQDIRKKMAVAVDQRVPILDARGAPRVDEPLRVVRDEGLVG